MQLDLLFGGFPCQDLSVAGQRRGLAGERSGLFFEFARVAEALRPRWLLIENVPGLLSSQGGRDFGVVLGTLADLGYGLAWRVLDSRYFGVPQRRRRVFIVGARVDGDPVAASVRAGEVLAVGTRCPGHPATLGEAGPDVAGALAGCSPGGGWRVGADEASVNQLVTHTLRAEGHDASEDGTGRGVPIIAHALNGKQGDRLDASGETFIAATLSSGSHPGSHAPGRRREDDENLVAYTLRSNERNTSQGPGNYIAGPLGGGNDGIGRRTEDDPNLVLPYTFDHQVAGSERTWIHDTPAHARSLTASKTLALHEGALVRRLTPLEAERLQGCPDAWTNPTGDAPDSQRYSALGDMVTVPVAHWIASRIRHIDAQHPRQTGAAA